ncbi:MULTISPECIES: hypothetical protein [Streptomyces]|uniref:hypothetical protein n=1 Tax=Streptomyces TaxID=1883 RepID=UPI00202265ED|nr:hypothetical protein [Streptomyces sp. MCA2]MCL7493998.1 hypothetical protein [Streptomyces sp. MCA2]
MAVNVTFCPKAAGFGAADAKVKVGAMVWPSAFDDGGGPFSSLPEDLDVLREVGINLARDLGEESRRRFASAYR